MGLEVAAVVVAVDAAAVVRGDVPRENPSYCTTTVAVVAGAAEVVQHQSY